MTRTVLLTLGRLPTALDLARGFAAIGWRVVVAEPFAWHLCRPSRAVARSHRVTAPTRDPEAYAREILAIAAREGAELILPVSEETMHLAALHDQLPPGVRLYAPRQSAVLTLHGKRSFNALAASVGLPVPETVDLAQAPALLDGGRIVIKPNFSCSGRGVRFLDPGETPPPADPARPMLAQRFLAGEPVSSFSIAWEGRILATSLYRAAVTSGTVAVAFERVTDRPDAEAWIRRFAEATGHSGFLSFDFIIEPGGEAMAIECNPRVTSGIHFLEPADLARAILAPEIAAIAFRPQRRLQQFYPCLTETQASLFKRRRHLRRNFDVLRATRDVAWAASDPLPFLLMPITSMPILRLTVGQGLSFAEAATADIEWA
jgi:predicted ATP-grasp superfamily ATP-dependent carboligase